jgi:hypothetical protein
VKFSARTILVAQQTLGRVSDTPPGHATLLSVLPLRRQVAIIRKCREGSVVGELRLERLTGRQLKKFAFGRRHEVASAVALLPPLFGLEVVERVNSQIRVLIVNASLIATLVELVSLRTSCTLRSPTLQYMPLFHDAICAEAEPASARSTTENMMRTKKDLKVFTKKPRSEYQMNERYDLCVSEKRM